MKSRFAGSIFLLSFVLLCSCSPQISDELRSTIASTSSDGVFLQDEKIVIAFKMESDKTWEWFNPERSTLIEYEWQAGFDLGDKSYLAGYILFRSPGKKTERGSLKELIKAGDVFLYHMRKQPREKTGDGYSVAAKVESRDNIKNQVVVTSDVFAIVLDTKEIVEGFRESGPEHLHLIYNLPGVNKIEQIEMREIQN